MADLAKPATKVSTSLAKNLSSRNFDPEKFAKSISAQSDGDKDLQENRSRVQALGEETAQILKKQVYHNYQLFIDTAKEISYLEGEMFQLNHILTEQKNLMEVMTTIFTTKGQSDTPHEDDSKKKLADREHEQRKVMSALVGKIEGCTNVLETPGRYLVHDGDVVELDTDSFNPIGKIHLFLFNDCVVVTTWASTRRGNAMAGKYKFQLLWEIDTLAMVNARDVGPNHWDWEVQLWAMEENGKVDYENIVLQQIGDRNRAYNKFATLITSYSQLHQVNNELQKTNDALHCDIEKLRQENHDLSTKAHAGIVSAEKNEQFTALEQKLFRVQEELTEVHRTKGARAQQILDLNVALQEKEKEISSFNDQMQSRSNENALLKKKCEDLKQKNADLEQAIQTVKDNYQALQILSDSFESKLRKSQSEYNELLERFIKLKETQVVALNTQNDADMKKKNDVKSRSASIHSLNQVKSNPTSPTASSPPPVMGESTFGETIKKKISDIFSVKPRAPSEEEREKEYTHSLGCYGYAADVRLPQEVVCKWRAHESEVMAVKFSSSGGILATGGADRLIHIWNFIGDKSRLQHTLRGSNGSITNIDFDPMEAMLVGTSNDYATRIWAVNTQRLKLTLTGHGGRVTAARFLGSAYRLASGSLDRTVKVWDVRSGACTRTFMAGSSCNDIVAADAADCLASGHFDRKIRVWDARVSGHAQNEIVVGGRVTSLDMPADRTSLICCTKDHTLELVDIRKSAVLKVFSHDQFKVLTDQTRCAYSVDGEYIAVGSGDGTVLAWNVKTGNLESTAKHHDDPVVSCSWSGGRLVTGDKHRHCVLWTGT